MRPQAKRSDPFAGTAVKPAHTRRLGERLAYSPHRALGSWLRRACTANFVVSAAIVLTWLVYGFRAGLPIQDRFLGLPYVEGPPWIDVAIFDAFVLVCLFGSPRSVASQIARFAAAIVGLAGATCICSQVSVPAAEAALGLYVWASHVATAIFWRSSGS
jgi:hypothetical protein